MPQNVCRRNRNTIFHTKGSLLLFLGENWCFISLSMRSKCLETAHLYGSCPNHIIEGEETGKVLGCNDRKKFSLWKASFIACRSPINSSNMTKARLGRQICPGFIKDESKRQNSCDDGRYGGIIDERRCGGRTSEAFVKKYGKVKREFIRYHAYYRRVSLMELGPRRMPDLQRYPSMCYFYIQLGQFHSFSPVRRNYQSLIPHWKRFPDSIFISFLSRKTLLLKSADNYIQYNEI